MERFILDPIFQPGLLVAIGIAAVLGAILAYSGAPRGRHRLSPAALRALGIAAIVFILARPSLERRIESPPGPDAEFAVLIDTSRSMRTADMDGMPRIRWAADLIRRAGVIDIIARRARPVIIIGFDDGTRQVRPEEIADGRIRADGSRTDIGRAIAEAIRERPDLSGMMILSDGRDNSGRDPALERPPFPVLVLPVGGEAQVRDIALGLSLSGAYAFAGQEVTLEATVFHSGLAGTEITVNLERPGAPESRRIRLGEGPATVSFRIREDSPGEYTYRVNVPAVPGEVKATNNRRSVFLRVVDGKVPVLVLEGRPSWDTRFARRALGASDRIDLTSVTQIGLPDGPTRGLYEGKRAAVPGTWEELRRHRVIVLGGDLDRIIDEAFTALLDRFVGPEHSGHAVLTRPQPYQGPLRRINELDPIDWAESIVEGPSVEATEEGRGGSVLPATPRPVPAVRRGAEKGIAAQVLARWSRGDRGGQGRPGETGPVIAYWSPKGAGKVVSIGAMGIWRWDLRPGGDRQDLDRFWTQLVLWLEGEIDFLPGETVSFKPGRTLYEIGEEIDLRIRTRDIHLESYRPTVEVTGPLDEAATGRPPGAPGEAPDGAGATREIRPEPDPARPGAFTARVLVDAEGEYEAILRNEGAGKPPEMRTRFAVATLSTEELLVSADPRTLERIAEASGGRVISGDDLASLGDAIEDSLRQGPVTISRREIWDRPPLYGAVVLLFAVEWWLRRRRGMS